MCYAKSGSIYCISFIRQQDNFSKNLCDRCLERYSFVGDITHPFNDFTFVFESALEFKPYTRAHNLTKLVMGTLFSNLLDKSGNLSFKTSRVVGILKRLAQSAFYVALIVTLYEFALFRYISSHLFRWEEWD